MWWTLLVLTVVMLGTGHTKGMYLFEQTVEFVKSSLYKIVSVCEKRECLSYNN